MAPLPRLGFLACVLWTTWSVAPVHATVDATGRWHVTGTDSTLGQRLDTDWDFVQTGTALTAQGLGIGYLTGSIDPSSGDFSLAGPSSCPTEVSLTGTLAPAGNAFAAHLLSPTGPFSGGECVTLDFNNLIGTRCGNGLLDPGEECDDGNLASGDCCSAACQLETTCPDNDPCTDDLCDAAGVCHHTANTASCDDGIFCNGADSCSGGACSVHAGDPCTGIPPECNPACNESVRRCVVFPVPCEDDGNACTLDVCTDAGCQHLPVEAGLPGDCGPCEACDGTGSCGPVPRAFPACVPPREATLLIRNRTPDTGDQLKWIAVPGRPLAAAELGDPLTTDDYALCVYDESGAKPTLLLRSDAPLGGTCGRRACWKKVGNPPGSRGLSYADTERTPNGIAKIVLRLGPGGEAKITLQGRGDSLPLPAPAPLPVPLRVQLQAGHAGCWEARFNTARVNDGETFRAER